MYNKAILIGRLGKDPELRYTASGTAVTKFTLATNRRWRGKDGQSQEETTWHDIVCWARTAEIAGEYLKKGSLVFIEGEIQKRNWQDKNGNNRVSVEINARTLQMLDSKGSSGRSNSGSNYNNNSNQQNDDYDNIPDSTEDDVPF